ncbi:MAG: AAA family ATPase [Eggerthellaceae bacterium]|nr:AAA family ATPase [Eggerthellaceae bacterium]
MTAARNPFTPTFGVVPPVMAGRDELLMRMRSAFENGLGDPNLSTIIIGARGTGKTALLSCIADEAQQAGWLAVNVVASEGMLEDILQRAMESASEIAPSDSGRHITGIDLAQIIGIQWETDKPYEANWRTRMNALFAELASHDVGLLVTVDEVKASIDEMLQLVSTYQLFVREGKKVALVMAGLPKHVSSLVSNQDVSFLRRSRQHYLSRIGIADVKSAFARTVESAGKTICAEALQLAADSIGGFPYMMQLVGYFTWLEAFESLSINLEHVKRGVQLAREDLDSGVLNATYRELSEGDRTFLRAMLADAETSRLANVARRMGKPNGYASTYKSRLADQGIIEELPDGSLAFAIPFFREYVERISAEQ